MTEMTAVVELPQWKCTQGCAVRAAKIERVEPSPDDTDKRRLYLDHRGYVDIDANARQFPEDGTGGYYVRYEDGYESFSPAGAFESGYTRA